MVVLILCVVNEDPVPKEVPPEDTLYQLMVVPDEVAPRVTVPASQREPGVPLILRVADIEATTEVRDGEVHPKLDAST